MATPAQPNRVRGLVQHPVVRLFVFYVFVVAGFWLLGRYVPQIGALMSGAHFQALDGMRPDGLGPFGDTQTGPSVLSRSDLALSSSISMIVALALMLPVAWVYVTTRKKRGYDQSIVQTLLILPIAIAGVVILVQDSIELAFALAGIVAGVRFRNTLDDTKDAVYVFVAIGVGLAAGVQALHVAIVTTIVFNLVALLLWETDFGRAPPALDGLRARRRIQAAVQVKQAPSGGGGSEVVDEMEQQLLKSMTPEQLQTLIDKAQLQIGTRGEGKKPNVVLLLHTSDPAATRQAVEALLPGLTETWTPGVEKPGPTGGIALQYRVRFKKGTLDLDVRDKIQAACGADVSEVEIQR